MMIRDWLLQKAEVEFFSFDRTDFGHDCDEILKENGLVSADDLVNRDELWASLRAWQTDKEYLSSLNLHRVIARHVRISCRKIQPESDERLESCRLESWVKLERTLDGLADEIASAIRVALKVLAPSPLESVPKFSEELRLDPPDKFHQGLERLIGYPPTNSDFLELMKQEHEEGENFADQKGNKVYPKVEWNIVMKGSAWDIVEAGCGKTPIISHRDCEKHLSYYVETAKSKFKFVNQDDGLKEAEVAALRLWTGPMHKKYAEILRKSQNQSGPYVTTLHAINSGITKLARIWPLPVNRKVYRGYSNLVLSELNKQFRCMGGVEKSVLATSEDFDIAVNYSKGDGFILEIEVGQVNRGADVSWLSQFPHEKEVLFNALSNLEIVSSPQMRFVEGRGKILVYKVCISANVKSKTLEEFVNLRRELHVNLVETLAPEVRHLINKLDVGNSNATIKELCKNCRLHSERIIQEAKEADVSIYNTGTEKYVGLVTDAILFRNQTETIINLALRWIASCKAEGAEVDNLLDWQLSALRTTFRLLPPKVTTIVLKQDHRVRCLFNAQALDLGTINDADSLKGLGTLLSLNPSSPSLTIKVASAELWDKVFNELCCGRWNYRLNSFYPAEYAITTLQQLELCNLDENIAGLVAPALIHLQLSALTSLSLRGSPIHCAGAVSLGRAFTWMRRLRSLDLRSCNISSTGCTGISRHLSALIELEDLTLAHNKISDDGFDFLTSSISSLASLTAVDMRDNHFKLPSLSCGVRCFIKTDIVGLKNDAPQLCGAWNPDGTQIASGSIFETITIWDSETGRQVSNLNGHSNSVLCVAWNPEGNRIASGSGDCAVIIWDIYNKKAISTLKDHAASVQSVAWDPEGNRIASGSDDCTVIIWDAYKGKKMSTLKGHSKSVHCVAWSPKHNRIAGGSEDCTIIIWDAYSGEEILKLGDPMAPMAPRPIGMTFGGNVRIKREKMPRPTPTGSILKDARSTPRIRGGLSTSFKTPRLATLSVMRRAPIGYLEIKPRNMNFAWNPNGDLIAMARTGIELIIWDVMTGLEIWKQVKDVVGVAWSPKGEQIVCGGEKVIIWDVESTKEISVLSQPAEAAEESLHCDIDFGVMWSPKGSQIATGCLGNRIFVWDVSVTMPQTNVLRHSSDVIRSVTWSPGGDRIASAAGDSTIIIWDAETGGEIRTLKRQLYKSKPHSVAWSPLGDKIAAAYGNCRITIWDAKTSEQVLEIDGQTSEPLSVTWNPSGDQLACGAKDCMVFIWNAKTGRRRFRLKGHTEKVRSVAWNSAKDQIVSGSSDRTLMVWNADTGENIFILKEHADEVYSVHWSPSGDQIVSASDDRTIIIWDAMTGTLVSTLLGHSSYVKTVAWSPSGDQIVSGGYGAGDHEVKWANPGEIIVWNVKTGDRVAVLRGYTKGVRSVAWSPGGHKISAAVGNTIIILDAKTGDHVSCVPSNQSEAGLKTATSPETGTAKQDKRVTVASEAMTTRPGTSQAAASACGMKQAAGTDEGCVPPPAKKSKALERTGAE